MKKLLVMVIILSSLSAYSVEICTLTASSEKGPDQNGLISCTDEKLVNQMEEDSLIKNKVLPISYSNQLNIIQYLKTQGYNFIKGSNSILEKEHEFSSGKKVNLCKVGYGRLYCTDLSFLKKLHDKDDSEVQAILMNNQYADIFDESKVIKFLRENNYLYMGDHSGLFEKAE